MQLLILMTEVKHHHLSVTLPVEWIQKIDRECHEKDMSKSRYVLRLLEKAYSFEQKGAMK